MKKILVPIDGSPNSIRGLEKAIEFASNDNSSITLLHIATLPPVHIIGHSKDKVKKSLAKKSQKFIKDAEDRCINQSVPGSGRGWAGPARRRRLGGRACSA